MSDEQKIPTPFPLLLKRVRYQVLPVLTMLLCSGAALWLWNHQAGVAMSVGEVNATRISVESKIDGVLVDPPLAIHPFDTVVAGQVIALLDSSATEAQIEHLEAELARLRAMEKSDSKTPSTQPIAYTIASLTAQLQELQIKMQSRELRAPIGGTVVEIKRYPGQAVLAGGLIMVIAAEKGDYIVSYLREYQTVNPSPGMSVEVRLRNTLSRTAVRSFVQSVSPQVEAIPPRQLRNPNMPEWGTPVQVAIPPEMKIAPGQLVDLFFRAEKPGSGG